MTLEAGKRYNFKISGFKGDPPRFWLQKTDLLGNGDLEAVVKREGKFPWLVDDKGEWTVRNDVYFQEARLAKDGKGSPLSATSNGKSIGPEQGFGQVMGTFHNEQVLLIKTAQGNRSLGFDFRPPSSGRTDPDSEFESIEYKLMVEGVRKTLDNIYNAAGIDDYDWHNFGPDLRNAKWDYTSFDPKETLPQEKGNRYRKVTYPEGMESWAAPNFYAAKAGWKSGLPPFGQLDGKLVGYQH